MQEVIIIFASCFIKLKLSKMKFTKKFVVLFFSILLLFNFSCNKIFVRLMGYKPPYFETEQSLRSFMVKEPIEINAAYQSSDSSSFLKLLKINEKFGKIITFNKDGIIQTYNEKNTCPGPVENYLNGICNRTPLATDSTVNFKDFLNLLKPFNKESINKIDKSADYTFVIFWAVYYGKKNQELHKWNSIIENQKKDCKINVLFVNIDFGAKDFGFTKRTKINTNLTIEHP